MNYLSKIAFLGKRQLMPLREGSDWIVAKQSQDNVWTQEFRDMKGLGPQDDVDTKLKAHSDGGRLNMRNSWRSQTPYGWSDGVWYYNQDLDMLFYNSDQKVSGYSQEEIQQFLKKISTMSEDEMEEKDGTKLNEL